MTTLNALSITILIHTLLSGAGVHDTLRHRFLHAASRGTLLAEATAAAACGAFDEAEAEAVPCRGLRWVIS